MYKVLTITSEQYHPYGTPEFREFMKVRTNKMLDELKEGQDVFVIDSDVVLFKPYSHFVEKIGDNDMIGQVEYNGDLCTGFFVCKSNEKTIDFWTTVIKNMEQGETEEYRANELIRKGHDVKLNYFPLEDVLGYSMISQGKIWNGEEFLMPKCNAFHANYTVGMENKNILLEKARKSNKYHNDQSKVSKI